MFIMLDLIKSRSTVTERRAGETWIRCHLRSYARLLEPIIMGLLEKRILWRPATYTVTTMVEQDEEKYDINNFEYVRPFDWDISDYMFETLMDIVRFGGHGALRSFASYHVLAPSNVSDALLEKLSISAQESVTNDPDIDITYLDALIAISLR
jgi:hypothetical protein